jgi:sulfotransferase family protein
MSTSTCPPRPTERVTSVEYARPYRPWPIAAANRIGRILERFGIGGSRFNVDDLVADARAKTGLHRFDDESFREPLGVLCDSIEREAQLTPLGRAMTRRGIVGVLANRLRATALFEAHPEILEHPIVRPIFIVGLQRAGTTMLHRLLAADPGLRALRCWEALRPVPLSARSWTRDSRIDRAIVEEHGLRYMAPDFFAVHSIEAEAPEEEIVLLDYSFLSTVAEATLSVPSYADWLERQDQTPAYAYLGKLLQLLQWQEAKERWILKTPHHLEWLDTLIAMFPDATIIETHRDPLTSLASFCSMIAHGQGVFSDRVDPRSIGAHWTRKTQRMVNRAMATRDRVGPSRFIDVSYYDLIADPMGEVQKIYRSIGRDLTPEARAAIEAANRARPQNKYGTHRYDLDHFGLDPRSVDMGFARYRARYEIPHEGNVGREPARALTARSFVGVHPPRRRSPSLRARPAARDQSAAWR